MGLPAALLLPYPASGNLAHLATPLQHHRHHAALDRLPPASRLNSLSSNNLTEIAGAAGERKELAPAARAALSILTQPGVDLPPAAVSRLRRLPERSAGSEPTPSNIDAEN